jgi:hypothetical protein
MVAKGVFPAKRGVASGNTELRGRKMDFGLFGTLRLGTTEKRPLRAFFWDFLQLM